VTVALGVEASEGQIDWVLRVVTSAAVAVAVAVTESEWVQGPYSPDSWEQQTEGDNISG